MSVDLVALALSVRTLPDVRSCLLLSRDGLVLSAEPPEAEAGSLALWTYLGRMGSIERGFIQTDRALWVFCQRGPYQVVVDAVPTARPGLILGAVEQTLIAGEQARLEEREALRSAASKLEAPPSSQPPRFRAPLHREPSPAEPAAARPPAVRERSAAAPAMTSRTPPRPVGSMPDPAPAPPPTPAPPPVEEVWEVDVVQLAREFGALYGGDE